MIGAPGVGKSRLLAEVIAVAEAEGWSVIRLFASPALSEIPLGVVSHLVPPGHTGDVSSLFRRVRAEIRQVAPPDRLLVAIDDAHELDAGSASRRRGGRDEQCPVARDHARPCGRTRCRRRSPGRRGLSAVLDRRGNPPGRRGRGTGGPPGGAGRRVDPLAPFGCAGAATRRGQQRTHSGAPASAEGAVRPRVRGCRARRVQPVEFGRSPSGCSFRCAPSTTTCAWSTDISLCEDATSSPHSRVITTCEGRSSCQDRLR